MGRSLHSHSGLAAPTHSVQAALGRWSVADDSQWVVRGYGCVYSEVALVSGEKSNAEKSVNLEEQLTDAMRRLRGGRLRHEAQVKQSVILPILRALGWNTDDPE